MVKQKQRPSRRGGDPPHAVWREEEDDMEDDMEEEEEEEEEDSNKEGPVRRAKKPRAFHDDYEQDVWIPRQFLNGKDLEHFQDPSDLRMDKFPTGMDFQQYLVIGEMELGDVVGNDDDMMTHNHREASSSSSSSSSSSTSSSSSSAASLQLQISMSSKMSALYAYQPSGEINAVLYLKADVLRGLRDHWPRLTLRINGTHVQVCIAALAGDLYLKPSLLDWVLQRSRPAFQPKWLSPSSSTSASLQEEDVFSGTAFLDKITQAQARDAGRGQSSLDRNEAFLGALQGLLRDNGLTTKLRNYQLQGVAFLFQCLTAPEQASQADIRTTGTSDGWLPLCAEDPSSGRTLQVWYNLLTECIRYFPNNGVPPSRGDSQRKSALLSDEMGLGKSLQILCLTLLLKLAKSAQTRQVLSDALPDTDILFPPLHDADVDTMEVSASSQYATDAVTGVASRSRRQRGQPAWRVDFAGDDVEIVGFLPPTRECLCAVQTKRSKKLDTIVCPDCRRAMHISCCGYASLQDALSDKDFKCISCRTQLARRGPSFQHKSNGVLLMVPDQLVEQWKSELEKHFDDNVLSLHVYRGIANARNNFGELDPLRLAEFDIVIAPLKVLQSEFHLANMFALGKGPQAEFRIDTSTAYFPPPLFCINFDLVVVDETQRLETSCQTLSIARRISANMKVSVSGTPLGNNRLDDLMSLFQFLEVAPFDAAPHSWKAIFGPRLEGRLRIPLAVRVGWAVNLVSPMMRRCTKLEKAAELDLDARLVEVRVVAFSDFEQAAYDEKVNKVLRELPMRIDASSEVNAKNQLEILRKGCCHPQLLDPTFVPHHGRYRGNHRRDAMLPFLEIMLVKADQMRTKAEDSLRALVISLNSMAGNSLLQGVVAVSGDGTFQGRDLMGHQRVALHAYRCALQILHAQRSQTTVLVSTMRVSADEFLQPGGAVHSFEGDGGRDLFSSFSAFDTDGVAFTWIIDKCRENKGGGGGGGSSSSSSSSRDAWTALPSVYDPKTAFDLRTPFAVSAPHALPLVSCNLVFSTGRRIRTLEAYSLPSSPIARLSRKHTPLLDLVLKLVNGLDTTSRRAFLFPRVVDLLTKTEHSDVLCGSVHMPYPFPQEGSEDPNPPRPERLVVPDGSHRSKTWKVAVKEYHPLALVVRRVLQPATGERKEGDEMEMEMEMEVAAQPSVSQSLGTLEYHWVPLPLLGGGLEKHVCLRLSMEESVLDMDPSQELHILHNLVDVCHQMQLCDRDLLQSEMGGQDHRHNQSHLKKDDDDDDDDDDDGGMRPGKYREKKAVGKHTSFESTAADADPQLRAGDFFVCGQPNLSLLEPPNVFMPMHSGLLDEDGALAGPIERPDLDFLRKILRRERDIERHISVNARSSKASADAKLLEIRRAVENLDKTIAETLAQGGVAKVERRWWLAVSTAMKAVSENGDGEHQCFVGGEETGQRNRMCSHRVARERHFCATHAFLEKLERAFATRNDFSEGGNSRKADANRADEKFLGPEKNEALRSLQSVGFLVERDWNELQTARQHCLREFTGLGRDPSQEEILLASDCRKCRDSFVPPRRGPPCKNCSRSPQIKNYKTCLYSYKNQRTLHKDQYLQQDDDDGGDKGQQALLKDGKHQAKAIVSQVYDTSECDAGMWVVLASMAKWLKTPIGVSVDGCETLLKAADLELERFDKLKDEQKAVVALWTVRQF